MKKMGIVVLILACFASPVSAGCAWVLWASGVSGGIALDIYPKDAFTDRKECLKHLVELTELNKQQPNTVMNFYCLPDTVDPRGPKEK